MKFNYCIARFWSKDSDSLCVYTLPSGTISYGTQENAEEDLAYVNSRHPIYKEYFICKIEIPKKEI